MEQIGEGQFYLVREDVLTESMQKMLEAKRMLARGEVTTIQEATKRVGLSRSAFTNIVMPCSRSNRSRGTAS